MMGPRVPRYLVRHYCRCVCEGIWDEADLWIVNLNKEDYPPQCGWASSNSLGAWLEQKVALRANLLSLPDWFQVRISGFCTQPGTCTTSPSGYLVFMWQIMKCLSLHNHLSQFLRINKSLSLSLSLSIYLLRDRENVRKMWCSQRNERFLY